MTRGSPAVAHVVACGDAAAVSGIGAFVLGLPPTLVYAAATGISFAESDTAEERVAGIEAAQSVCKAEDSGWRLRWSASGQAHVVPSTYLLRKWSPRRAPLPLGRAVAGSSAAVRGRHRHLRGPGQARSCCPPVFAGRSRDQRSGTVADSSGRCAAISSGVLRRDSVSPRSRPRRRGLRKFAACACRPTVRAVRRGPRWRRSRPSPG